MRIIPITIPITPHTVHLTRRDWRGNGSTAGTSPTSSHSSTAQSEEDLRSKPGSPAIFIAGSPVGPRVEPRLEHDRRRHLVDPLAALDTVETGCTHTRVRSHRRPSLVVQLDRHVDNGSEAPSVGDGSLGRGALRTVHVERQPDDDDLDLLLANDAGD